MGNKKEQVAKTMIFSGVSDDDSELIPIIADGDEQELKNFQAPDVLPILPLRNTVLFPGVVIPDYCWPSKILEIDSGCEPDRQVVGDSYAN